jgi:excisionase family DNA binding protein
MDKDFYSIKEFAKKLNVSEHTIRRAIKSGRISAFRVGATEKSTFRIAHSEISRLGVVDLKKLIDKVIDERNRNT